MLNTLYYDGNSSYRDAIEFATNNNIDILMENGRIIWSRSLQPGTIIYTIAPLEPDHIEDGKTIPIGARGVLVSKENDSWEVTIVDPFVQHTYIGLEEIILIDPEANDANKN